MSEGLRVRRHLAMVYLLSSVSIVVATLSLSTIRQSNVTAREPVNGPADVEPASSAAPRPRLEGLELSILALERQVAQLSQQLSAEVAQSETVERKRTSHPNVFVPEDVPQHVRRSLGADGLLYLLDGSLVIGFRLKDPHPEPSPELLEAAEGFLVSEWERSILRREFLDQALARGQCTMFRTKAEAHEFAESTFQQNEWTAIHVQEGWAAMDLGPLLHSDDYASVVSEQSSCTRYLKDMGVRFSSVKVTLGE